MPNDESELERAAKQGPPSMVSEWVSYLSRAGKWWLLPVLLVLMLLGALLLLTSSPVAPFIYSVF